MAAVLPGQDLAGPPCFFSETDGTGEFARIEAAWLFVDCLECRRPFRYNKGGYFLDKPEEARR